MFKKIILSIVIIIGMISTASASIRPNYVELLYGLEPVEWMALIGIGFAFLDNIGRAWDKKRKTPEFEYNYAYLGSTIIAMIVIGLSILGMEATSLGIHEILIAVGYGMGMNLTVKEGTKGTR